MSVIEIKTEEQFKELVATTGNLIVVDFYAEWCGPCKQIAPKIQELAKAKKDEVTFCKVDVDDLEEIAQEQKINAMPTFKFIIGGKQVAEVVGASFDKINATILELTKKDVQTAK